MSDTLSRALAIANKYVNEEDESKQLEIAKGIDPEVSGLLLKLAAHVHVTSAFGDPILRRFTTKLLLQSGEGQD